MVDSVPFCDSEYEVCVSLPPEAHAASITVSSIAEMKTIAALVIAGP